MQKVEKTQVKIFSNPTDGDVIIDFADIQEQVSISLFDQICRLIQTQSVMATELVRYQLPAPSGIYFFNMTFSDGSYNSIMVIKE